MNMATVELWYAVYGGVITSIQVALDTTVDQLRASIVSARKWSDDPAELTLHLAKDKQANAWLKVDTNLTTLLQQSVSPKYETMLPPLKLKKPSVLWTKLHARRGSDPCAG